MAAARQAIQRLTQRNFVETQHLTWNIADVYGLRRDDGAGWYLKLYIDEQIQVTVISFHPLERPIRANGGWIRP